MISDETLYKIYTEIGLPPLTEPVALEDEEEVIAAEFAVTKKNRSMQHLRRSLNQWERIEAA